LDFWAIFEMGGLELVVMGCGGFEVIVVIVSSTATIRLDICWKIACSIDVDLNAGQTKHHDD
jgi:hypothetical protein